MFTVFALGIQIEIMMGNRSGINTVQDTAPRRAKTAARESVADAGIHAGKSAVAEDTEHPLLMEVLRQLPQTPSVTARPSTGLGGASSAKNNASKKGRELVEQAKKLPLNQRIDLARRARKIQLNLQKQNSSNSIIDQFTLLAQYGDGSPSRETAGESTASSESFGKKNISTAAAINDVEAPVATDATENEPANVFLTTRTQRRSRHWLLVAMFMLAAGAAGYTQYCSSAGDNPADLFVEAWGYIEKLTGQNVADAADAAVPVRKPVAMKTAQTVAADRKTASVLVKKSEPVTASLKAKREKTSQEKPVVKPVIEECDPVLALGDKITGYASQLPVTVESDQSVFRGQYSSKVSVHNRKPGTSDGILRMAGDSNDDGKSILETYKYNRVDIPLKTRSDCIASEATKAPAENNPVNKSGEDAGEKKVRFPKRPRPKKGEKPHNASETKEEFMADLYRREDPFSYDFKEQKQTIVQLAPEPVKINPYAFTSELKLLAVKEPTGKPPIAILSNSVGDKTYYVKRGDTLMFMDQGGSLHRIKITSISNNGVGIAFGENYSLQYIIN